MFLQLEEIHAALEAGDLALVRKQCQTYGTFVSDHEWSEPNGFFTGFYRRFEIRHYGKIWGFFMCNGEILKVTVG